MPIPTCGLQSAFTDDARVNLLVRRASSLPLVRLCDLDDVWLNALNDADLQDPQVLWFADYVPEQWVESPGLQIWNHFETNGARTTNHVEGWHSKLKKVSTSHPNIHHFAAKSWWTVGTKTQEIPANRFRHPPTATASLDRTENTNRICRLRLPLCWTLNYLKMDILYYVKIDHFIVPNVTF